MQESGDEAQEIDASILALIEKGLLEMSYDEKQGDWVFWLKDGAP